MCTTCFLYKEVGEFYERRNSCKLCVRASVKKYADKNKDKIKEYNQTRRKETEAHKNRPWIDRLKRYGLSEGDFMVLYEMQLGRCDLCKNTLEIGKNCHVDHDHKTGYIRGLLCGSCNLMLGHAKDNIETLKRAIEYLEYSERMQAKE